MHNVFLKKDLGEASFNRFCVGENEQIVVRREVDERIKIKIVIGFVHEWEWERVATFS